MKRRVLFLGNSYTYVNNLPQVVLDIALSKGDTLIFDQSVIGGYTFQNHWSDPATYSKLKSGKWDAMVIQGQSQEPSFTPAQVMSGSYPYAKNLADSVRKYDPCAEVIFYMTWGRKNGDADNCQFYPPVCTFDGMNARLRESYLMFADSFNASCAPVGVAWKKFRTAYPTVELYQADESHPSMEGSYLAACVFYSTIFKKAVTGCTYYSSVNSQVAQTMQSLAASTVLDSAKVWNLNSHLPVAAFTYSLIGENNFQFMNQSLNATSFSWSFGSSLPSPQYQFPAGSAVTVTLTAQNNCTTSTTSAVLVLTGIKDEKACEAKLLYRDEQLKVKTCAGLGQSKLLLYNINGQLLRRYENESLKSDLDLSFLSPGVYLVKLISPGEELRLKFVR